MKLSEHMEMLLMTFLKRVLGELHKDEVIDCNQYQGKDFNALLKRCLK